MPLVYKNHNHKIKYGCARQNGKSWIMSDLLNYSNGKWTNEKGNQIFFEGDYLLKTTRNRTVAFAQKPKSKNSTQSGNPD